MISSSRWPARSVGQDAAEVLLGRAGRRAVVVGEVEVRDAEVERAADDRALARRARLSSPKLCQRPSETAGSCEAAAPAAAVGHRVVAVRGGDVGHARHPTSRRAARAARSGVRQLALALRLAGAARVASRPRRRPPTPRTRVRCSVRCASSSRSAASAAAARAPRPPPSRAPGAVARRLDARSSSGAAGGLRLPARLLLGGGPRVRIAASFALAGGRAVRLRQLELGVRRPPRSARRAAARPGRRRSAPTAAARARARPSAPTARARSAAPDRAPP